jgi:hypothetical protein
MPFRTYIAFFVFCSIVHCSVAQESRDYGLFINVKSHQFYDSGVYELGQYNQATGYGLGFGFVKPISKGLTLNAGYSFALADSLPYRSFYTSNAVFHQLEANLDLNVIRIWRLQTAAFTGYTYNWIQQIDNFGYGNGGLNINIGGKAEAKITPAVSLAYRVTFGFSLSENVPYNFKNQLGILLYPNKINQESRSNRYKKREKVKKLTIKKDLIADNEALRLAVDSLRGELQRQVNTSEMEKDSNFIVYSSRLLNNMKDVEEYNRLLLYELRNKRNSTDSIYSLSFNAFAMIDSTGRVLRTEPDKIATGYYLLRSGLATLSEAVDISKTRSFSSCEQVHFLNRFSTFFVLGYLGDDKDNALEYFQNLGELKYVYDLIKL